MRGIKRVLIAAACLVLAAPAVRAVEKAAIDEMEKRGVAFLRKLQQKDGSFPFKANTDNEKGGDVGATALATIALLECDVPKDDPAVKAAVEFVRQHAPTMTQTYSISLAIMLFDRFRDEADIPLIESLMVRLMAGQSASDGGWGYSCPPISEAEVQRLRELMGKKAQLRAQLKLPEPGSRKKPSELPPEIQQQVGRIMQQGGGGPGGGQAPGVPVGLSNTDNSNTQFALFALWVGRKHGLPVDGSIVKMARFKAAQNKDGTWSYYVPTRGGGLIPLDLPGGGAGDPAAVSGTNAAPSTQMTCAGVLAMAVFHGAANDQGGRNQFDANKDETLNRGLAALGHMIGEPDGKGQRLGEKQGKAYYCLWSVERVCVSMGLERLGGKDWYNWGAEILLANQGQDGSWRGYFGDCGADTAFSLLFLRRANLAADLRVGLKQFTLKARPLPGKGLPKALGTDKPPSEDKRPTEGPKKAIASEQTEADKLSDDILKAKGEERRALLEKFQKAPVGGDHTDALALSIHRMTDNDERQEARAALQLRLLRFSEKTLFGKLEDSDSEIRAAAALACANKEFKPTIPHLIKLLADLEPYVVRCANKALKLLSNQDFGPAEADIGNREATVKAIADWKAWWDKNGAS